MNKVINGACFMVLLFASSAFSLNVFDSDKGVLNLNFWGQPSYCHLEQDDEEDDKFDFGRYRLNAEYDYKKFSNTFLVGYEDEEFELIELSSKYKFNSIFSLSAGMIKAPFGRMYSTCESELLMYNRNPLSLELTPKSGAGLCSELALFDSTVTLGLGAFIEKDSDDKYNNSKVDYSGVLHIKPFGKMSMSESYTEIHDEFKLDIAPCFHYNAVYENSFWVIDDDISTFEGGFHAAGRYKQFACDFMVFINVDLLDSLTLSEAGFSMHIGYTLWSRLESSLRFSFYDFSYDYTEHDDGVDYYYSKSHNTNTLELGMAYHIKKYNSKIGVYYLESETRYDYNMAMSPLDVYTSEVRVYVAFEI